MNTEEIIDMARHASIGNDDRNVFFHFVIEELEAFAKLVDAKATAREREEIAQFIENDYVRQFENPWREDLTAAIRNRGDL